MRPTKSAVSQGRSDEAQTHPLVCFLPTNSSATTYLHNPPKLPDDGLSARVLNEWVSGPSLRESGQTYPRHSTTNRQGCVGTNGEPGELTGALRETSVLGLRLAGTGREDGAFVTLVIEGEHKDTMKSGMRCSERDWE